MTKRHIGFKWIHVTKQTRTIYATYKCITVLLYTLVGGIIQHSRVGLSLLYPSFCPPCSIHPIATTTLYPRGWNLTYVYLGTVFVNTHFSYYESVHTAHCIHCINIIHRNHLSSFLFNKVELLFAEWKSETLWITLLVFSHVIWFHRCSYNHKLTLAGIKGAERGNGSR